MSKTVRNIQNRLKTFFRKHKLPLLFLTFGIILLSFSLIYPKVFGPKPNTEISFLGLNNEALLENKNPSFNVQFGSRVDTSKQVVRFEAKADSKNPFEEEDRGFFKKIINFTIPKKTLGLEMSLKTIGGESVSTTTELLEESNKKVVVNSDVVEGVDIRYEILEGVGVKEDIVIKDREVYLSTVENPLEEKLNEFIFDITLDDDLEIRNGWFTLNNKSIGEYYLTDNRDNYVGHFLPSWAIDSKGDRTEDVKLEIEQKEGNNYTLKVVVDPDWLFSEDRVYPIVIDPSIVHDTQLEFDEGVFVDTEYPSGKGLALKENPTCSGGTTYQHNGYTIHKFTTDGTFVCNRDVPIDFLIVAGGGGGGGGDDVDGGGGGGGAGGLLFSENFTLEDGSYSITVGDGGAGVGYNVRSAGSSGSNSSAFGYTAIGGGGGGSVGENGLNGGSGGGAGRTLTPGSGTTGQGNSGGSDTNPNSGAGGGGGAEEAGSDSATNTGGDGGDGKNFSSYFGESVGDRGYFAGGGGGGSEDTNRSSGGLGGGGNGGVDQSAGISALSNTGGGGGGAGTQSNTSGSGTASGNGGSGIVLIRIRSKSRNNGEYTSSIIDLSSTTNLQSLSWTDVGSNTSDGETPYSNTDLIAQWNFNETSGTTALNEGSCGSSCNGTLNNFSNTTGQDVAINSGWTSLHRKWGDGGLMFDGTDDYVSISNTPSLLLENDFSISFWMNAQDLSRENYLLNLGYNNNNSIILSYNNEELLYSEYGTSLTTLESDQSLETGKWYNIVWTRESGTVSLYVNGSEKFSGTSPYNIDVSGIDWQIGYAIPRNKSGVYYQGSMDNISIYSRALSSSEILSNYQAGNIEFQYRTSTDGSTWTDWIGGSESVVDDLEDTSDWESTNSEALTIENQSRSMEGSSSLGIISGEKNVDANTVGYWKLDETSGTGAYLKDYSGNANHGTPSGTTSTEGKVDRARYFNGSSDYVNIPAGDGSVLDLETNNFSIELWFKTQDTSGTILICGPTDGDFYEVGITDGKPFFGFETGGASDPTFTSDNRYNTNEWTHIVAVRDGREEGKLYINGNLSGSFNINSPSSAIDITTSLYIGSRINSSNYFQGDIDNISISTVVKTPEEIEKLYSMGKDHYINKTLDSSVNLTTHTKIPFWIASETLGNNLELTYGDSEFVNYQPDTNTFAFWHMNQTLGEGAYLKDSSGNDRDLTPNGASPTNGKIGNGYNLDGTNDTLTCPNSTNFGDLTVSLWFKNDIELTGDGEWLYLFQQWEWNSVIRIAGNQSVDLLGWGTTEKNSGGIGSIYDTNWHHIVVTRDQSSGELRLYLDGTLIDSWTGATGTINSGSFSIGKGWTGSTTKYYDGSLDEIRVDTTVRTPSEIKQAYEIGKRTHDINVTFKADLQSSNLITGSGDTSFDISETPYGATNDIENLSVGEKIILKENYNGIEYIAQGTIDSTNESTGAVTVSSWDTGSTFPSVGFGIHTTVFKWQKEYIDIRNILPENRDAISLLTFRKKTNKPSNFWIDDIKASTYLTDKTGDTFTPVEDIRYVQYKTILTTYDENIASDFYIDSVSILSNSPPTAPTDMLTEGETSPAQISTTTPDFSAIYNDPDTTDTSTKYQIQVNTQSDFLGTEMWDSGEQTMTLTNEGTRSPDITYAGDPLSTAGTTYYWRIKFWDNYDNAGEWSSSASFVTNSPPTEPTDLLTNGLTNPTDISTHTPTFSAIYNDADIADTTSYYEIEINTQNDFLGTTIWDTDKTSITITNEGERIPNVTYTGDPLSFNSTTYYWRIKFWDNYDNEGSWSTTNNFTTISATAPNQPTNLLTDEAVAPQFIQSSTPSLTAVYTDPEGRDASAYQIQVNTQNDFLGTEMWDSEKTPTTISDGNRSPEYTYDGTPLTNDQTTLYWRIKFWNYDNVESIWSEPAQFPDNWNKTHVDGINFGGISLN